MIGLVRKLKDQGETSVFIGSNKSVKQEAQETCVRFPGREDLLEEGMATHSSILAW